MDGTSSAGSGAGTGGSDIKGNADSMLYHTAASPYYGRTRADVWFDSESTAESAGFTRWDHRDRNAGGDTDVRSVATFASVPDGTYGPGSADPNEDGSGPAGYEIKGNADSMLYHTPASAFYNVTNAEVWFRSEEDARNAGFRSFTD